MSTCVVSHWVNTVQIASWEQGRHILLSLSFYDLGLSHKALTALVLFTLDVEVFVIECAGAVVAWIHIVVIYEFKSEITVSEISLAHVQGMDRHKLFFNDCEAILILVAKFEYGLHLEWNTDLF